MRWARWRWMLLLAGLLLVPAFARPAAADAAIYYSAPENVYGWCAGYSSGRAHSCAEDYCVESGGTDCRLAEECGGGWGAVALAQEPARGFAAVCGARDALTVRSWAMAHCMVAANTLCWTDSTFREDGSDFSADANMEFDLAFLVQGMLQLRGYELGDADGKVGPKTRAAIEEFQKDVGLPATGKVSNELFFQLLDALGGVGRLVRSIDEDLVEPHPEYAELGYAHAPKPAALLSFSQEMLGLPAEQRLTALAYFLSSTGTRCTAPAKEASLLLESAISESWHIVCAEGDYTVVLSPDGSRMTMSGRAEVSEEPGIGGGRKRVVR